MTVAAAASVPACSKDKDPGPIGNPPPPERFAGPWWSVRMENMKCWARSPAGDVTAAPRAIECPPGMSGSTTFVIGQVADKECGIVPPDCAAPACVKIRTPCPLPPGQQVVTKLANVWAIEKRHGKCHAEEGDIDDCPPGITEEASMRVAEMPDATCVIAPPGCKDTSCVGDKIACPSEQPVSPD